MSETLKGKWHFRSFRHDPVVVKDGKVDGNPQLATPWAPLGELDVDTDEGGNVRGTLTFTRSGIALKITGRMTPATDGLPASVEITGEKPPTVYRIKGFFVPESDHVVGTVLSVADDVARQPVGTAGAFVLFPVKP